MPITLRPGTLDDSYAVYQVFLASLTDLSQRIGVMAITGGTDPQVMAKLWETRRPLFEHLARTAEHFWVAEQEGQIVGFARSILRGGMRELTEFFVQPGVQSGGVGRELLARAFPREGAQHRSIVATLDQRAQGRYIKAGVYPRCPIYFLERMPERLEVTTGLHVVPLTDTPAVLDVLGAIDEVVLGHQRPVDHQYLMTNRQGYLYVRNGQAVGYGYVGSRNGPFALLDPADFPTVLALAETEAAQAGLTDFGLDVPTVNQVALDYLLGRGFRIDPFITLLMSDEPFGRFDRYLLTTPAFFL